jgi:hypothetical protein
VKRNTRRCEETRTGEALAPRVAVALEEYRALREEIIASLSMQQAVLSFSTLALGGLALAGFHELGHDGSRELALLIFLLVFPLVSYVSLFIWLGEYARTTRAGLFLAGLETRINDWIGEDALGWEQFLRTRVQGKSPQYAWNSWAVFFFYGALPVVAVLVAMVAEGLGAFWLAICIGEAAVWIGVVYMFLLRRFLAALEDADGRTDRAEPRPGSRARRSLAWAAGMR